MADPVVVILARQFKARVLLREEASTQALVSYWINVEQALETIVEALAIRVNDLSAGQRVPTSVLYQLDRYREFQAQAAQIISTYQDYAEGRINESVRSQILFGMADSSKLIATQTSELGITFNLLPTAAIDEIIALTQVEPISQVLDRMAPLGVGAATQILIKNTALGINPTKTAREMVSQGLAQSLSQALLVNRDLQLRAYRNTSLEQYRVSGVVNQYQRIATKDIRVCPGCMAKDGDVQSLDELIALHAQDRCSVIPIIQGSQPFEYQTVRDWFAEQPVQVQQTILGPGRFQLYTTGQASLSDFAMVHQDETWGPVLKTVPLYRLNQNKTKN